MSVDTTPPRPVVAIVGRPNVGKSTLLNRVIGRREAIVEERPGVTRDRKQVLAEWAGREFDLVDTGGWLTAGSELDQKVSRQSERAIREADVVVVVVDATVGITEEDSAVATLLRGLPAPVVVAVNKVDDQRHEPGVWEFMALGLGDPIPVSALHGRGTGDLLDTIVAVLPEREEEAADDDRRLEPDGEADPDDLRVPDDLSVPGELFSVAIVGRPNVGKSTLFNRLIGDEVSVTHDMPGTTRDSVDTVVVTESGPVRFVDTAGMRRRARIDESTEYFSMVRALRSIDGADAAVLVIDATEGVTHQDQRLAERVDAAGCPIVVVVNKWELIDTERRRQVADQLEQRLHFLGESTVIRASALRGKNVHRLVPALAGAIEGYRLRVPTRQVNDVIRDAQQRQPGPHGVRVLYATQGATDPPTFTLFSNKTIPPHYLRYLERSLREHFGFGSTPITLRVRRRTD